MKHRIAFASLLLLGGLAGCEVAPPSGPDVTAMPGPGKNLERFTADDVACRQYAASRLPSTPSPVDDHLQYRYDVFYAQCMAGRGERAPDMTKLPPEPYAYPYAYPYPYYDGPGLYVRGGWGWR